MKEMEDPEGPLLRQLSTVLTFPTVSSVDLEKTAVEDSTSLTQTKKLLNSTSQIY